MTDADLRRFTGVCGIAIGVLGVAAAPLYFVHSGAPPAWNVLTRVLLNLLAAVVLVVFFAGLRRLIRTADGTFDGATSLMYGAALIYTTVTLVAASLEAGVVFDARGAAVDPTVTGLLAHANVLLHGSISRLVTALLLVVTGHAVLRSHVLPRPLGWAAIGVAAVNLAFVPSMYTPPDPEQFYSALGWGNTALAAGLIAAWTLAAGITLVGSAHRPPHPSPALPERAAPSPN